MIFSNQDDRLEENRVNWRDLFLKNPYRPGAGTTPEYLAGRDNELLNIETILNDLQEGGMATHTIYYGVRGVGKTVLLKKAEELASSHGYLQAHFECDENFNFKKEITINFKQMLKQLSTLEKAKDLFNKAKAVLLSFNTTYSLDSGEIGFSIDNEILNEYGNASSGELSFDTVHLFIALGELAKKCNRQICLFFDEIQNLDKKSLIALISALHRTNQLDLPILLIGAGLPTILRAAGDAKSYSERLFIFTKFSYLEKDDAIAALVEPAKSESVLYANDAVEYILDKTQNYPYFIQQYGKIIWKLAKRGSILTKSDAETVYEEYINTLDNSFFGVRFNRSTKKEKELLYKMAEINKIPCSTKELAKSMLGDKAAQNKISTFRNNLINKGLIYSPSYGEIDFTVPMFADFLNRVKKREQFQ